MTTEDSDPIEEGIRAWARLHPELDLSGTEVVARIVRLSRRAEERMVAALTPLGLTFHGHSVLAVLRTADKDGLRAAEICARSHLTSGGLTNLLHRLEGADLVERAPDPEDGRASVVTLTAKGRAVADAAVAAVTAEERTLVEGLPARDRRRLAGLLSALVQATEETPARGGD
ncbi:MAG: MarR family winged helix-turn-helix transcriptional regulator [Miltoncostaeaceae bacterium]